MSKDKQHTLELKIKLTVQGNTRSLAAVVVVTLAVVGIEALRLML